MSNKYQVAVEELLTEADISINGRKPWDIQVHDSRFYTSVLRNGSLGLGESYMQGWWSSPAPDGCLYRLLKADLEERVKQNYKLLWLWFKSRIFNQQTKSKAVKAIGSHYDIGNDLYRKMLDPLMNYSCGYWKNAKNLSEAQLHKLDLICQKLKLKPGQRVLDIGCGWGGFAWFAAKNYKVEVVGVTISKAQKEAAEKRCKNLPVDIRFQDYRELQGKFDRICSIGMLEHVGHKNYENFMNIVKKCLNPKGLALLHFIGGNKTKFHTDAWINKYIFPQGLIPSIKQIGTSLEEKLILEDWHNFGLYYDKTLMAWYRNFKNSWPDLKENYSDTFYRMWEFYLCACAASFRSKKLNLWQLVLTHPEANSFYESVRPQEFISEETQVHLSTS